METWTEREVIEKRNEGWLLSGDVAADAPFGPINPEQTRADFVPRTDVEIVRALHERAFLCGGRARQEDDVPEESALARENEFGVNLQFAIDRLAHHDYGVRRHDGRNEHLWRSASRHSYWRLDRHGNHGCTRPLLDLGKSCAPKPKSLLF